MSNQLMDANQNVKEIVVFGNKDSFELSQRMALLLSKSELVPKQYQGNIANCTIALEMAMRIKASPMSVMQNLFVIQGKPSWSSQFIIAVINACGKFSPLRFVIKGEGMGQECYAYAIEKETGERLEGPAVSMSMAKEEGWYSKPGSKWKTMQGVMLRYRAASFFGRLYAPDLLMGMQTREEVIDSSEMIDISERPATGIDAAKNLLASPSENDEINNIDKFSEDVSIEKTADDFFGDDDFSDEKGSE